MYIKILVYMIDNQRSKYKISILFFWLVDRLPFLSPTFASGGVGPKTAARPGRFRGGGPSRTPYPIKGNHLPIGYLLKPI
nr:MAG TPA: hypothetical protein [Caudoviricetes sp.]